MNTKSDRFLFRSIVAAESPLGVTGAIVVIEAVWLIAPRWMCLFLTHRQNRVLQLPFYREMSTVLFLASILSLMGTFSAQQLRRWKRLRRSPFREVLYRPGVSAFFMVIAAVLAVGFLLASYAGNWAWRPILHVSMFGFIAIREKEMSGNRQGCIYEAILRAGRKTAEGTALLYCSEMCSSITVGALTCELGIFVNWLADGSTEGAIGLAITSSLFLSIFSVVVFGSARRMAKRTLQELEQSPERLRPKDGAPP